MYPVNTSYAYRTKDKQQSQEQGLELWQGRFFMKPDLDNHSNVAVINADLATDIMGRKDVVGENIKLDGKNFLIIGVLKEDESSESAITGSSYAAYVPYTSLIRLQISAYWTAGFA